MASDVIGSFRVVRRGAGTKGSEAKVKNYGPLELSFDSIRIFNVIEGKGDVFVGLLNAQSFFALQTFDSEPSFYGVAEVFPSSKPFLFSFVERPGTLLAFNIVDNQQSGQVLHGLGNDSDTFDNDADSSTVVVTYRHFDSIETVQGLRLTPQDSVFGTGFVELVDSDPIEGFAEITVVDLTPFEVIDRNPVPGEKLVNPNTDVTFRLLDNTTGLDVTSLNISVGGLNLVVNGAEQFPAPTFNVEVDKQTPNNDFTYTLTTSGSYPLGSKISVFVSGQDLASPTANVTSVEYLFSIWDEATLSGTVDILPDEDFPYINNPSPKPSTSGNNVCGPVCFELVDDTTGIDLDCVVVDFDGFTIFSDGQSVTDSGTVFVDEIMNGYQFCYQPNDFLEFGREYCVSVSGCDNYGPNVHTVSSGYCFFTINNDTLSIENFFIPEIGDVRTVGTGTFITVDVLDQIYGINTSGTRIFIDDVEVNPDFMPISGGYTLSYQPGNLFNQSSFIDIKVHAENNQVSSGCSVFKEEDFALAYGYRVVSVPEEPYEFKEQVVQLLSASNVEKNVECFLAPYIFTTHDVSTKDLTAYIDTRRRTKDLEATIFPIAPLYYYNKIMTVKIEASDLEGNEMEPFEFTFRIEKKPN